MRLSENAEPDPRVSHSRRSEKSVAQELVSAVGGDAFGQFDGVLIDVRRAVWVAVFVHPLNERLCGF